jgi:hypothetical protein
MPSAYRLFFNNQQAGDAFKIGSIAWSRDGKHYSAQCTTEQGDRFTIVDGKTDVEVQDFASNTQETHENQNAGLFGARDNRAQLVSPDGKHVFSLAAAQPRTAHGPTKAVSLDGNLIPCEGEQSEVTAFFTPDSKHVVWIDWGGRPGPNGRRDYYDMGGYSVYVDGQLEAHFECPMIRHMAGENGSGIDSSVARYLEHAKNTSEMGADGALIAITQVGNVVKKLRVTPAADINLNRFAALAAERELTAEAEEAQTVHVNR